MMRQDNKDLDDHTRGFLMSEYAAGGEELQQLVPTAEIPGYTRWAHHCPHCWLTPLLAAHHGLSGRGLGPPQQPSPAREGQRRLLGGLAKVPYL